MIFDAVHKAAMGALDIAMPESKADLLASANEAAGLVQKVFFTYLLVSIYLAILIGSTTHEQLLRASGVQLPLFGVPLSIFWVYAVAPWLYLALHVNLLVQHYLLSRKLHAFNRALERPVATDQPPSIEEQGSWRVRLYPSIFAQILAGAERGRFKRFVLRSTVFLTVAVAPIVLLLWMQIQFLPYHSEPVTWGNRFALLLDLGLLWYYWPLMMSRRDFGWWQIVTHEQPLIQPVICVLLSLGTLFASWALAVVPGGHLERMTPYTTDDDWWRKQANAADTWWRGAAVSIPEECQWGPRIKIDASANLIENDQNKFLVNLRLWLLKRHLDVRGETLLDVEPPPQLIAALANQEAAPADREKAEEKLRKRTTGLDLKGRDLRGAILEGATLTKADLSDADLHGAHLGCAKLAEAVMKKTKLDDAVLSGAVLRLAKMPDAELHRVDLSGTDWEGAVLTKIRMTFPDFAMVDWPEVEKLDEARLIGADFRKWPKKVKSLIKAKLQAADLSGLDLHGTIFNGASLQGANLSGTNLSNAHLQKADLTGARLSGADLSKTDLSNANLQGADLSNTTLQGVILFGAEITGANFDGTDYSQIKLSDPNPDETERKRPSKPRPKNDYVYCGEKKSSEKIDKAPCVDKKSYDENLIKLLTNFPCSEPVKKLQLSDAEASALREALRNRAMETKENQKPIENEKPVVDGLFDYEPAPANEQSSESDSETMEPLKAC